jgi:hypothetical protein
MLSRSASLGAIGLDRKKGRSTDAEGDEDVAEELLLFRICTSRLDRESFIDACGMAGPTYAWLPASAEPARPYHSHPPA